MTTRPVSRTLLAVLLAGAAACASDAPTAAPSSDVSFRRGDRPAALAVAGLWDGAFPIPDRPNATREWTLNLVQREEKLEGSLTTILTTEEGRTFYNTVSLVSGSGISGRTVTVQFPTAEGAEARVSYVAEVSADGRSMTGWYSYGTAPITLVRR